ncbi:MAG: hypothetical protein R3A45_03795 [Bdellovibrionota bacterium]
MMLDNIEEGEGQKRLLPITTQQKDLEKNYGITFYNSINASGSDEELKKIHVFVQKFSNYLAKQSRKDWNIKELKINTQEGCYGWNCILTMGENEFTNEYFDNLLKVNLIHQEIDKLRSDIKSVSKITLYNVDLEDGEENLNHLKIFMERFLAYLDKNSGKIWNIEYLRTGIAQNCSSWDCILDLKPSEYTDTFLKIY